MASSKEHYERVLTPVYSWMHGGFEAALGRNADFFDRCGVRPARSGLAVDLGAGCGFQSIPLARLGFDVTAIDLDRQLLDEMRAHMRDLSIEAVQDDLLAFSQHLTSEIELAVCMTDTLLHLDSRDDVSRLINDVFTALEAGGRFIVTFRDLTTELEGLDRFIPVRSDSSRIFTCFLEYETDTVKVHDLVYTKTDEAWQFAGSYYRKLRLSQDWVAEQIERAGFAGLESSVANGLVTLIASKGG
jgi:SAM-dependent methyltransferase